MNVLSVFDGISLLQLALVRAGIKYDRYYASEIDPYAQKITQKNFPKTVQMGGAQYIKKSHFMNPIHFLAGGSPCQGLSKAGNGLNFNDPRSKLFFEFVRIKNELQEINPDLIFLLENVKMKKEWRDKITNILEVNPIEINSCLVSAQNRQRMYWSNIPDIKPPKDKRVFLNEILEKEVNPKYFFSDTMLDFYEKRHKKNEGKRGSIHIAKSDQTRVKAKSLSTGKNRDSSQTVIQVHNLQPRQGKGNGGKGPLSKNTGKTYCLDSRNGQAIEFKSGEIRKLTPLECERLQTVPDNYTAGVSDTQRYKQLGNGFTADVIAEFCKKL